MFNKVALSHNNCHIRSFSTNEREVINKRNRLIILNLLIIGVFLLSEIQSWE